MRNFFLELRVLVTLSLSNTFYSTFVKYITQIEMNYFPLSYDNKLKYFMFIILNFNVLIDV